MKRSIIAVFAWAIVLVPSSPVEAQQALRAARATAVDEDTLIVTRQAVSQPTQRLRIADLGNRSVQTGDSATQAIRSIVAESFREQAEFAERMNRDELVKSGALVALPEVDDEVLVFDDAYVIRRSTTIIVKNPQRVARASTLYRNYLGERAQVAAQGAQRLRTREAVVLDSEERAGMREFMEKGVDELHRDDPIRAAAAKGEDALLAAIEAGLGELTVVDTLVVPRVAGIDQGRDIRIPTIRNGILDLKSPVPATSLPIRGLVVTGARPEPAMPAIKATPAVPERPSRAPLEPKIESSGKANVTTEFLLGITRVGNFQWERKWVYVSGYFRLTLGAGFAFGYRVPVVATATIEPTRGYIRDYSDKKVIIGASASVRTVNGNAAFYERAGLKGGQIQDGDELLLEANVGYGYRFRAFWKTIRHRPYTAVGISYSQGFKPPMVMSNNSSDFGVDLDPKTTKISYDGTFLSGSASIRFLGKTWGALSLDLKTLVDDKVQNTFALDPGKTTAAGVYPYKLTLDPVPLRQGQTIQTRPFGIRFTNPGYTGRVVVVPGLKFTFGVGYKSFKRTFSTSWINLADLVIDTGNTTLTRHDGTRAQFTWDDGEKIYHHLDEPPAKPGRMIKSN